MGVVERAVDAAANFIGPFVDTNTKHTAHLDGRKDFDNIALVREAIEHLQAINTADLSADPDAPYDASLAGVVYGLLDLTASLGIIPYLSPSVVFSQRPRSVLITTFSVSSHQHGELLTETLPPLLSILEQTEGTGLQPLLAQRSLPDIISALAELSFSPQRTQQIHYTFEPVYNELLARIPTSRLLPVLTTFLQQPLPAWLKPRMAKELAMVPTRPQGVKHVIEFLSLSYLSKSSRVPQDASGPSSRIPIPLEAVTQATRLLISPPNGTSQDEWIQRLEPQLWFLLDGAHGREMSRAAAQIVAGGVLSKKITGAPGTVGWNLFAKPILDTICPSGTTVTVPRTSTRDRVLVQDQDLLLALQRLSVIVTSYSHAGLIKRLVGPILLPLWALLNYARSKQSVHKAWCELPRSIFLRYIMISCDPKQIDKIATALFWDGMHGWTLGPGTEGGIEIRSRQSKPLSNTEQMNSILSRISDLADRVDLLVSLLADAKVSDDVAGLIFLEVTKRWLSPSQNTKTSLLLDSDEDPLIALTDAKLSEALASKFRHSFARSPQHIIELMNQLLQNYVSDHRTKSEQQMQSHGPSITNLGNIVVSKSGASDRISDFDTVDDDLVSFAISILNTLVTTPSFKRTPEQDALLLQVVQHLEYLMHTRPDIPISSVITNAARSLLQVLSHVTPTSGASRSEVDPLAEHRAMLKEVIQDLTSPEAPNRTWALRNLLKLIQNHFAFPVIDIPSTTHLILSASLADTESFVHTAAVPVLVALAIRTPQPVIKILVDAFIDVDERSLKSLKGQMTDEKEKELQDALDYRLRVGEVLDNVLFHDEFWGDSSSVEAKYRSIKQIAEACLSLASRRGQRRQTKSSRQAVSLQIMQQQEEAEAAWGGPIPNLLEPDSEASNADRADYDALSKIVRGWEDTGTEEDVRIRTSAMSIFGTMLDKRLQFVDQLTVDAGLQIVLLVLTMETNESYFILRRAAILVVMGLLRALDKVLNAGEDSHVVLGLKHQSEVERVLRWSKDVDSDELVRDHAESVMEGLETLRMKKIYRVRDEGVGLGPDLGLEGGLQGLYVRPSIDKRQGKPSMIVEEIE